MNKKYNGFTYVWELSNKAKRFLQKKYLQKYRENINYHGYSLESVIMDLEGKTLEEIRKEFNMMFVYDLTYMID